MKECSWIKCAEYNENINVVLVSFYCIKQDDLTSYLLGENDYENNTSSLISMLLMNYLFFSIVVFSLIYVTDDIREKL